MSYVISPKELDNKAGLAVVGCGGTGGFVAEGLCRLLGDKETVLLLVDHDRVEQRNLRRQNFYEQDIGKFKSQALAERLSRLYGRQIAYSVYPFDYHIIEDVFLQRHYFSGLNGIIIGCVDNPVGRQSIADMSRPWAWWIDTGNGDSSGQILIGNTKEPEQLKGAFCKETGVVTRLPLPTVQEPSLLAPVPAQTEEDTSCAEAVEADLQSPLINLAMATLALEFVKKLLEGKLTWMGAYIDLESGTLSPVPAEPRTVAKMVGVRVDQLMAKKGEGQAGPCPACGMMH